MSKITLGPFFIVGRASVPSPAKMIHLGFCVESASATLAVRVRFFWRFPSQPGVPLRLEHALFERKELPFDDAYQRLNCPSWTAVQPAMHRVEGSLSLRFDVLMIRAFDDKSDLKLGGSCNVTLKTKGSYAACHRIRKPSKPYYLLGVRRKFCKRPRRAI
jgi:hypothetical protein